MNNDTTIQETRLHSDTQYPDQPEEAIPANHLARFVVDIIAQLELSAIYKQYALRGGEAIAPEMLLALLFYGRLKGLKIALREEVARLFHMGERADQGDLEFPEGLVIQDEIAFRRERLENLAKAKAVLDARAKERYEVEKAEYDAKVKEREAKARKRHQKPRRQPPTPPEEGPNDKDQYNFTDPDSRIMKNSTDNGDDQHYNAQVAITQNSMFIVATSLSNHPNDKQEAKPCFLQAKTDPL